MVQFALYLTETKEICPLSKYRGYIPFIVIYRNIAALQSLKFRSAILGGGSIRGTENRMGACSCRQQIQGTHPNRQLYRLAGTDGYYVHEFMNGELRLLIDNVLLTDGLSKNNRIDLIRRLEGLSSKYFHSEISKIDMDIYGQSINCQVISTLEDIGEAIANEKQLSFHYCTCDTDCKLHEKLDDNGKPKQYIVNPYQIISRNGHSYLICNLTKYHDLTHFRIDRIKGSQVTATSLTPLRMLKGFETGIRLSEYVKEHPNLWSGDAVHITFQCKQYMMNDVVDSFGTNLRIEKLPDDMIKVHVHASESSILHWAIQFADAIEVLSPNRLREQIAETLRNALKKYES